jgi:arylsulfatase A-like enzyme
MPAGTHPKMDLDPHMGRLFNLSDSNHMLKSITVFLKALTGIHGYPVCVAGLILLFSPLSAEQKAPPNVIVILSDDVGWGDPGCYGGSKMKTPNLDTLAREGLRFTDAHASASVCTPTRYSLLTGQYSWRLDAVGLNKGVANGASPLLIPTAATTLPKLMKSAGYRTGAVGKWHLGFGNSKPDFNQDLTPGPLETGFDGFFGLPATNDRIPTVLVRDHRVENLDPADPIEYSYEEPSDPNSPLRKYASGGSRIGWMSGGKAAQWKDTELAVKFTREAVDFVERNAKNPFFLFYAPHNVHAPTIPGPRFLGSSGMGKRADCLVELDWSVGELMKTLERLKLAENTLVIFSSDNGAYVTDEDGHRPNGPWRGEKSQLWEGGHRVPFIARWTGHIKPGVCDDLVCLVDLPATAAALLGVELAADAAPDSFNLLPTLLGRTNPHPRDHLVVMSGTGALAVRQGKWKFIPDLGTANGWKGSNKKNAASTGKAGLYNLEEDKGETTNLHAREPGISKRLAGLLEKVRSAGTTRPR